MVYVGSCSGNFFRLNAFTGAVVWKYDTALDGAPQNFHGDALLTADLVVIGTDGTDGGAIYAFDREDGSTRWKWDAGTGVTSDIVRSGNRILAVTLNDELVCLDIATGNLLWRFPSNWDRVDSDREGLIRCSSPAVEGDRVFFGGRNGRLFALELETGEVIWDRTLGRRITTAVMLVDGSVVVGDGNKALVRVDARTGDVRRRLPLEAEPFGTPILSGNRLIYFTNWASAEGRVIAVDHNLTSISWQTAPPPPRKWISAKLLLLNDELLVGTNGGEIHQLSVRDGSRRLIGTVSEDVRVFGTDDDLLFIGTIQGMLYGCSHP